LSQCNTSELIEVNLLCVWVEEEETKCQERQSACENIKSENICKTLESSTSGTCYWIEKNETEPEIQCLEAV
jgi:hypothetical protein